MFPVDKSYECIWNEYFLPWFAGQNLPACDMPTLVYWKKVRWSEEFADVKRRAKHYHCRCSKCAKLQAKLLASFANRADHLAYQRERRLHDDSVTAWRKLEAHVITLAQSSPDDQITMTYDDTEALGLPRFTRRPLKNMPTSRFNVIPWYLGNFGDKRKDYVYMAKGRWDKGANRLITQLYAAIRRAKSNYSGRSYRSRRLTLIADNASENKNNLVLTFFVDMVNHGWFDTIDLLFGEPGHTHNGSDAVHKIHNVDVGNCTSGDLGHFISQYVKAWHSDADRPDATILDVMYDWKSYYSTYMRKMAGFTTSKTDPVMVRGWRILRNNDGMVEVKYKMDPAMESQWRGVDGHHASRGFFLLKSQPVGVPQVVPPKESIMNAFYRGQLKGAQMQEALDAHGLSPSLRYNYECAAAGTIPVVEQLEPKSPIGEWGPLCTIGTKHLGKVRFITQLWPGDDPDAMWTLPSGDNQQGTQATSNVFHPSGDAAVLASQQVPLVRYADVAPRDAPVYTHPANVAARRAKERAMTGVVSGNEEHGDFTVLDREECVAGRFCVRKAETSDNKEEINVGKVISVSDEDDSSFEVQPLQSWSLAYEPKCVKGVWHTPTGVAYETWDHETVIAYFDNFAGKTNGTSSRDGKMPSRIQRRVVAAMGWPSL